MPTISVSSYGHRSSFYVRSCCCQQSDLKLVNFGLLGNLLQILFLLLPLHSLPVLRFFIEYRILKHWLDLCFGRQMCICYFWTSLKSFLGLCFSGSLWNYTLLVIFPKLIWSIILFIFPSFPSIFVWVPLYQFYQLWSSIHYWIGVNMCTLQVPSGIAHFWKLHKLLFCSFDA